MMEFLVNVLEGGLSVGASLTNEDLSSAMKVVTDIAQTILTIIYIVLGLFLVIKGALLGMQIVKAADEPQVRQEKIGSLKWLVIGIAIAYGVSFVAQLLVNYFKGQIGAK